MMMKTSQSKGLTKAKSFGMGRIVDSTIPIPIPIKNKPV